MVVLDGPSSALLEQNNHQMSTSLGTPPNHGAVRQYPMMVAHNAGLILGHIKYVLIPMLIK